MKDSALVQWLKAVVADRSAEEALALLVQDATRGGLTQRRAK